MMFLWLQRKHKMGVATLKHYDQGVFLSFLLTWMILFSLIFRVWSIWAGWDCSKTCQREHLNLPPSTIREPCTKPGRSVSMSERSFCKWGRSCQRCCSFFSSRFMDLKITKITNTCTFTFAAPWRYQRRWDSTWRLQPLITGMIVKRLKSLFVLFTMSWLYCGLRCSVTTADNHTDPKPQNHSLKLDPDFKLVD